MKPSAASNERQGSAHLYTDILAGNLCNALIPYAGTAILIWLNNVHHRCTGAATRRHGERSCPITFILFRIYTIQNILRVVYLINFGISIHLFDYRATRRDPSVEIIGFNFNGILLGAIVSWSFQILNKEVNKLEHLLFTKSGTSVKYL